MSKYLLWVLRIVPALILLQTLFFKFSANEESVYIFTKLGVEPWGRIASGVIELMAGILLLIPRTTVWGALIGLGVMVGAVLSHLLVLGIEIKDDGGQLFIYALITLICCGILVLHDKKHLLLLNKHPNT